jgi:hypothetical protein
MEKRMNRVTWCIKSVINSEMKWVISTSIVLVITLLSFIQIKDTEDKLDILKNELTLDESNFTSHSEVESNFSEIENLFPQIENLTSQQKLIHELAEKNNIEIEQINFSMNKLTESDLASYKMNFSFTSDYQRMRQFISDFLFNIPNASLEKIEFSRDSDKSKKIDIRLTISFFYKA